MRMHNTLIVASMLLGLGSGAWAKLPAPSDEAKAKAAESAAKAAHAGQVGNYQLCLAMDRVVAGYQAAAKKAGKTPPTPTATPACVEPGPFVYAAAETKPIEAAGAHSPAATAVSPPSTTTPAAALQPRK